MPEEEEKWSKNRAGTQAGGLTCKDEITGLSQSLRGLWKAHLPLREEGRKGVCMVPPREGLGSRGHMPYQKRGAEAAGGSLQAPTLIIPRAARLLQMRTALAIQPRAVR